MAAGEFSGSRVAVVGLQRSNAAVVRYLRRQDACPEVYDRQPAAALAPHMADLPADSPAFCGPDYLEALLARLSGLAAIFVAPGVRKDLPVLQRAAAEGIPLWTEAAYALHMAPRPVIGITGSAGKTTTTSLVGAALTRHRPGSLVGGNIGTPLLDRLEGLPPDAWLLMELSSFQLELARDSPAVAALLNVRPNHLDQHGSYAAYVDAKRQIYRHQASDQWAVFSADDPEARRLAREAPGRRVWFSSAGPVSAGVGLEGDIFRWCPPDGGPAEDLLRRAAVRIPGPHNLANVAAALAIGRLAGIPGPVLAAAVEGFGGVPHRLESVGRFGGANWVNDSIATSPDRTLAALETFTDGEIVLLAGGYDKGIPFDALALAVARRCARVLLFGATAGTIAAAVAEAVAQVGGAPRVEVVPDLAEAVERAARGARPGQTVLLSPACASYGQFRDFEERGERFRQLVAALSAEPAGTPQSLDPAGTLP